MVAVSRKPRFIRLAQPTYGRWLIWRNAINTGEMEQLAHIEPPFLVLANHAHAMDPFIISSASPVHIRWVAGSYLFNLFGLRPLLETWIGAISKIQGRSDMHTIRSIGEALKGGDVVGLFPEGTRTWDGEPVGFEAAVAKLVKIYDVQVVVLNLEGFYALKPRWAEEGRRGTPSIRVVHTFSKEEIRALSTAALFEKLGEYLNYSYRNQQERAPLSFTSRRGAEGLEKLLYLCPGCLHASTIGTHRRTISCSECALSVSLDVHDRLVGADLPFDDVAQWHQWEREFLGTEEGRTLSFPPDQGVLLQRIEGKGLSTISRRFTLTLGSDGFMIGMRDGETILFPFASITSTVINAKNTLEITSSGVRYRIRIRRNRSIVKYLEYAQQWAKTETGGTP